MSIQTVEIRAFSGPATVELAGVGVPEIVEVRQGPQGPAGTNGSAATVTVGTTTTGNAGTNASVTNSGTSSAAVFNFTIPRGDTGPAGPNTVTSATTSDGTAILNIKAANINNDSGATLEVTATDDTALTASCSGIGIAVSASAQVTCAEFYSFNESAIHAKSASGAWTIESFDNNIAQSAIERVRGWFVWFYNTFTGRLKTADITANREWTLPDASGTIALTTSNVATATALETSRNIFGIAFNGTANVSGDATNAGHFASIPSGGAAGHFITLNGTAPTVIAGRSAWWSDASGTPSFRNGTGTAVTLVRSSDLAANVATALAVNVGSAGAFVVNGGALGTPSSGTLTSCTGLPISTGVSGLGANVATFLATPSSANLAAAVTDETGTGSLVFANGATITNATFTNCNGYLTTQLGNLQRAYLTSNFTRAFGGGSVNVTGLSLPVVAGKTYKVTAFLSYLSTGGAQIGSDITTPTLSLARGLVVRPSLSAQYNFNNVGLVPFTANFNGSAMLEGVITPSASGNVNATINVFTSGSCDVLTDSYIELECLNP